MKYWLGVVSKGHVQRGQKEGIAQVCHGKKGPLSKMKKGDFLVYYSPGVEIGNSDLKSFTAIGRVIDDEVYQFQMSQNFIPFRRNIKYFKTKDLPLLEVKNDLVLCSTPNWGYQLRRGLLEICKEDFLIIAEKMEAGVEFKKV